MSRLLHLAFSFTVILIGMVLEVELSTPPPTTNVDGLVFQQNINYNISIPDTLAANTLVLSSITVTSTASSGNVIQVSCQAYSGQDQDACSTFFVVNSSYTDLRWVGAIQLSKVLNALAKSSYSLTLVASNGRSFAYQNVFINVIHTQMNPPVFQGSLIIYIPELDSISASALATYTAQDGDGKNNPIRYQLTSNPGNYFRIEDVTGRLFNTKPISFNSSGWELGFIAIEVEAAIFQSGVAGFGNSTTAKKALSTIYLVESVDYPPTFDYPSYSGAVDERSSVDTVVQGISLKVTDQNRNVLNNTFELVLDNYSNVFKISPTNASQQTTASILVANSALIDYDTGPQTYQFNVIARETSSPLRLSSSAMVTIALYPKNDYPPVFTQSVYTASNISELITPGTFVLQVLATDRDVGRYGNASIRYKFGEQTSLFKINAVTGVVTVAQCSTLGKAPCIDYETVKSYQIPVIATDSYGEGRQAENAMINIIILDENDNSPIFTSSAYYGIVDEHTTAPYVKVPGQQITYSLQVNATDADSSRNGNNNVTYYIVDGNTNNLWTINPYDGKITANRPVNYTDSQNGFFNLIVEARDPDPSHIARAPVNISVNPINTYAPVLANGGVYTASILETIPPGTYIMTIRATDGDSPAIPNGMVRYRFMFGNQDLFTINDTTGEVRVAPGAKFDAIVQPQYVITVRASDLGSPSFWTDGNLTITVIPNRPDPKFTLSDYRPPPVLQSSSIGYNVTTVFANNTNPNRRIVYSFVEPITGRDARNQPVTLTQAEKQMFAIDPATGRVTVNQPLNYDRVATWQAVIQAVDTNPNSTVNPGTATITITVLPVNDKPPVFSYPWTKDTPSVNKTLEQWDTPGNNVMNVYASSPNSSQTITYRLVDDYNGAFNISSQTGLIGLVRPLDISRDTDVRLVVTATDNGAPPLTSTATILVQLRNINKYRPQFTKSEYSVTILNDLPSGSFVIGLSATDNDTGDLGQVRYQFINSPPDNRFAIDPLTGNITVTSTFNGTKDTLVILSVRAYDSPNDPISMKYTDTTVQINIKSRNTDPPVFSQPVYSINIPERSPVGQAFIHVLATKNNVMNPSLITYSITSGNDRGLFAIDPNSGGISPKTSLIGQAGNYYLTVTATDDGTPSLSGNASVAITVLGSSYQIPTWVLPATDGETVYINELDPRGTNVTQVYATNTNTPGSPVSYYFSYYGGTGSTKTADFEINSATGLITTARNIGYEGGTTFVVNVLAVDIYNTVARRTIAIVVRDIFEEYPSFPVNATDSCTIPLYWTIPINAPNGSIVNTLTANLKDPNDVINYNQVYSETPKEFPFMPFALQPSGSPVSRSVQIVYYGKGAIKVPNKMVNITIRAQDGSFNLSSPPRNPPQKFCHGVANQTDIVIHISIIETKPLYDPDLHTCIKDDADIGTEAYQFENLYPDNARPVVYQLISVQTFPASGSGSTPTSTEMGASKILSLSSSGEVVTLAAMSDYKQRFFMVNANSSYDQLSFATPSVTIYVVPYSREILATFNEKPEVVKANIGNVISEIQSIYKDAKVCVVSYSYHVTDQGVVNPSSTDVLMYVIDRGNNVVPPLDLDKSFSLAARRKTYIIGITEAYSFWAGFIYHPVAAAIGIILALLLLALILFCCCCFIWSRLLKCCLYTGDKEPLIYKASSLGVVNPVWAPKPQTEEQSLTMPVPDGDGVNRTIELMGEYNRPAIDIGDEDVIDTASRFQNGAAAGGAQSLSGYVHIEAPLTASRSPSAFGTPSAYGASQTRQEMTTTYESSATGAPNGGRESPYPDSSGAMDSHGSYSASGAMKFSRGTAAGSPPPPRSHSAGTMTNAGAAASEPDGPVRLNDPGNGSHAKIGATLFRPGGQAYAQSVISGTTFGGGDQYDMLDETVGLHGAPHDARMALPLDTEVMYSHVRPTSYYDDADIMPNQGGMYQGEVRVGRNSVISEQLQETRFM